MVDDRPQQTGLARSARLHGRSTSVGAGLASCNTRQALAEAAEYAPTFDGGVLIPAWSGLTGSTWCTRRLWALPSRGVPRPTSPAAGGARPDLTAWRRYPRAIEHRQLGPVRGPRRHRPVGFPTAAPWSRPHTPASRRSRRPAGLPRRLRPGRRRHHPRACQAAAAGTGRSCARRALAPPAAPQRGWRRRAGLRRVDHPVGCFTECVRVPRPIEDYPFTRTYIRATAGAPGAPGTAAFDAAADRPPGPRRRGATASPRTA